MTEAKKTPDHDDEQPEDSGKHKKKEKKEHGESEPVINLEVLGACKNPKGEYIGLREDHRLALGVKQKDKVVVTDSEGKEKIYTVGLGPKSKNLKGNKEVCTINGIATGEKITIKKFKEDVEDEETPENVAEKTHQKVTEKFGQQISTKEKPVSHKKAETSEKDHGHKTEDKRQEGENLHPKETNHGTEDHSADQHQETPKEKGFFSKLWGGISGVFKRPGAWIKKVTTRNNPKDPLGFERQKKLEIPRTPLLKSPFYLVGDMIDGTAMNGARRLYEVFSPFVKLPGAMKGKKFGAKLGAMGSAVGQSIKGIVNIPFKGLYEGYLGLIQKPIGRIARILDRVPLIGKFVGYTAEGLAMMGGEVLKWVSEIPEMFISIVKGSGGESGHGQGGGHGSHGGSHESHGGDHGANPDAHPEALPHTGPETNEAHKPEGKESHPEAKHAAETPAPKEPEIHSGESDSAHEKDISTPAKREVFEALKDGKYGPDPDYHYPLNKETVLKYFDVEDGVIRTKKGVNLRTVLKKSADQTNWSDVGNKIIKYIRKTVHNGEKISLKDLVDDGLPKEMVLIIKESLGDTDFNEVMSSTSNNGNGNGNGNGAEYMDEAA